MSDVSPLHSYEPPNKPGWGRSRRLGPEIAGTSVPKLPNHAEGTAVDELDGSLVLPPFLLPPSVVGDLSAYFAEMWKLKPKPCDDTDDEKEV